MRAELPTGTVTFLFTDVEGSTRLLHSLGAEAYADALAEHRGLIREACAAEGGVEVDTQGDAFFFAFPTAPGALAAAGALTDALASGSIHVRVGLHTGTPLATEEGYVGGDVHRAARIAAAGHGGQVLVSASTATLVEPSGSEHRAPSLVDLGPHRLKDLSAPERIYQLGERTFPALNSLYRTNLPIPATTFLGRETELAEVGALLARDDVRLLTLTGPGGTGMTRLALQAVADASDAYPDGVFWVPLAPLRDPKLVVEETARAVGAQDGFAEHVADKRLLLLLDNFEHLLEATAELAELHANCPNLSVVATSREPLHLSGEQEYPVPPLAHEEAVGFFLARARAVKPAFEADDAVAEICRRLDELPLALELAAARVKALSSEQILTRLEQRLPLLTGGARDLPERQRTLRATIEWSHDLLNEDEQRLFSRLAIFGGGSTLEAAEVVCGANLDTLQSLVDKSLLRYNEERFWMLETIREYAAERLEGSGAVEELRRAHADYFLGLAEDAAPRLRDVALQGTGDVLDVLEPEHDNLRAALDWLEAAGETQSVLQMAGALVEFWFANDHWVELRVRLMDALAADEQPTAARARALIGASDTFALIGDLPAALASADEAYALYGALGDRRGVADALWRASATHVQAQEYRTAVPPLEQALSVFREVDDQHSLLNATRALAWTYELLGELERSRQIYHENLQRARVLGNPHIEAASLGALAMLAAGEGRAQEAFSLAREHVPIARRLGTLNTAEALARVASVLAASSRAIVAARILSSSEALFEESETGDSHWARRANRDTEAALREALEDEAFAEAWELGQALTLDEAVALALEELERRA